MSEVTTRRATLGALASIRTSCAKAISPRTSPENSASPAISHRRALIFTSC